MYTNREYTPKVKLLGGWREPSQRESWHLLQFKKTITQEKVANMVAGDDNTRSSKVGDAGGSAADLATNVRSGGSSGGGGGGVTKGSRVKALGAVAAWFASTVILISCNKVLMREHFRLPVFLTFLHMIVSYAWCEFSSEMVRNVGDRGKGGWGEKRQEGMTISLTSSAFI